MHCMLAVICISRPGMGRDIAMGSYIRVSICMYVNAITQKKLGDHLQVIVGTLGQHEFAFGFCGKHLEVLWRDPCSSYTLVLLSR